MGEPTAKAATSERDVLLATKLNVPGLRPDLVPRPRLAQRLDDGLAQGPVLVCAPAGYGKTVLLAEWVRRGRHPVAWLSLDAGDNDPARFWRHAVAAIDRVRPGISEQIGPLLGPPPPPSFEPLVTALINEIAGQPDADEALLLVLDDYHMISSQLVHESLGFLLEHRPPGVHLALTSRSDPPLALARLRASGQLTELRAADLRFTADEAAALQAERAGLFVVPLDEVRDWWRYHHLFADLLRARLQAEQTGAVPGLHRNAAAWYAERGLADDAIRHAVAAGEMTWAARLIEQHYDELFYLRGEATTIRRWLSVLPEDLVRSRPRLLLTQAFMSNIDEWRAAGLPTVTAWVLYLLGRVQLALGFDVGHTRPGPRPGTAPVTVPGLVEQLTNRELEVLQMLAAGKSNQAIAGQLVVSLDTVKKHVSHLLGKLGAANRTEAVARARELELIP